MGRPRKTIPELQTDRGRNRVWWQGRWRYLGAEGSDEARAAYSAMVAEIALDPTRPLTRAGDLLLSELLADYEVAHATPAADARTRSLVRRVVDSLDATYGPAPLRDFGPVQFAAWRAGLVAAPPAGRGLGQQTARYYTRTAKDVLAWAIRTDRVRRADTRLDDILLVPGLTRKQVRAPRKVLPVPPEHVAAVLPLLRSPVAAMVRLQLLAGLRPTELFRLRPCDVHRSGTVRLSSGLSVDLDALGGAVWVYAPPKHKTEHEGKSRDIVLGPKAQAVLLPFLDRDPAAPCFSPRESSAERLALGRATRKPGAAGNLKRPAGPGARRPGLAYTGGSYHQAIEQACDRAGIPRWHPYRLRHSAATDLQTVEGLDAVRAILGHSDPRTTLRYAERDFKLAAEVMGRIG